MIFAGGFLGDIGENSVSAVESHHGQPTSARFTQRHSPYPGPLFFDSHIR